MRADCRAHEIDQMLLNAKTLLYFRSHKFRIFQTISMADKENLIMVRTYALLHHVDKANQGLLPATYFAQWDQLPLIVHMQKQA